ncbi:MAG: hypothetical protein M5U01_11295 [Ardenticatenaceae bacterium]|nr:hypothetical protein [Ardenticatenaceae bacterium]HBY96670.1 hypothetical protein [Chloroflexota bacterium]
MHRQWSRGLALVIALGAGIITLGSFFVHQPILDQVSTWLVESGLIVAAFALLLGLLNVLLVHVRKIRERAPGWAYSLFLVSVVLVLLILGRPGTAGPNAPAVAFTFEYLLLPLQAAIFSLLAFFILAVAYQAVRATSWEMVLFLAAALIVVIGGSPLANIVPQLSVVKSFLLSVPVTAGSRGLLLGIALGVTATGLRLAFDGRRYFQ